VERRLEPHLVRTRVFSPICAKTCGDDVLRPSLRPAEILTMNHLISSILGCEKILSYLGSRERASYKEVTKKLGVTRARIHQILQPPRKAHILVEEQIGKELWFALGSSEEEADETVHTKQLNSSNDGKSARMPGKSKTIRGLLRPFDL